MVRSTAGIGGRRQRSPRRSVTGSLSTLIVAAESRETDPRKPVSSEGGCRVMDSLLGNTAVCKDEMNVSTKQQRIAELAQQHAGEALTNVHPYLDVDWLREAYRRTRKDGAPGIDGETWESYGENLEANLADLLDRAKSGRYRAPPVRRVYIPKGSGPETRPIGIPTLEDKVLQRAVVMLLEPILEREFHSHSYGFRPGRSAHQALAALWEQCSRLRIDWIVDADLRRYLDRCSYYPPADAGSSKRSRVGFGTLILRPLRLPCETWMASSSPRLTRCNTVWRDTPSRRMASTMGT